MANKNSHKWQVTLAAPEMRPIMGEEIELLLGQEDFVTLVLPYDYTNESGESACE